MTHTADPEIGQRLDTTVLREGDRGAIVFRHSHGQLSKLWTVHTEQYPYCEYPASRWTGGISLYGLATEDRDTAMTIATSWVNTGELPDGSHPHDHI